MDQKGKYLALRAYCSNIFTVATGNPQACFELGNGQNDMTLRIPLGTECGTVQQV